MADLDDLEYRVGKLAVGPDEALVVKFAGTLTAETSLSIARQFNLMFPGTRIIILDDTVDLSVVSAAAVPPAAAAMVTP